MKLEAAQLLARYGGYELRIKESHQIQGGYRAGERTVAVTGPPWTLPHALSRILIECEEEERKLAAEAVKEVATEIHPFDLIWY